MADRTKIISSGRGTSTFNFTVKKGQNDSSRPRTNKTSQRLRSKVHNNKAYKPEDRMLAVDPLRLKIRKVR